MCLSILEKVSTLFVVLKRCSHSIMAPSRGGHQDRSDSETSRLNDPNEENMDTRTSSNDAPAGPPPLGSEPSIAMLRRNAEKPQFTLRALVCGLLIGVLIAFSNTYFGLQTGWISGMSMPSALIAFATFKSLNTLRQQLGVQHPALANLMGADFSEVENVLVQTVAGSVGTMPLGCGFVGVLPALEFLLHPDEVPDRYKENGVSEGDIGFITPKPHLNPDLASLAHSPITTSSAGTAQFESTDPVTSGVDNTSTLHSPVKRLRETGLRLETWRLVLWALGLCLFGVVFAIPLRREVIVREKLRFPSGTATALVIGVLHGSNRGSEKRSSHKHDGRTETGEEHEGLLADQSPRSATPDHDDSDEERADDDIVGAEEAMKRDWKKQVRLLSISFLSSGLYTVGSYFVPQLHSIPFLGTYMSSTWLWNLNPSPAYIGQGVIMGPATTLHMFLGALLGWAILSPLAKYKGWAPGDVGDWEKGSKGWIVWVSLAIMLADAIVSLGWLILRPLIWYGRRYLPAFVQGCKQKGVRRHLADLRDPKARGYSPVSLNDSVNGNASNGKHDQAAMDEEPEYDAPPHHLVSTKTTLVLLVAFLVFCVVAVQISFRGIISIGLTLLALVLALLLSIMGVRALGETDLNPVSGISKLTQLLFAFATPPGTKNSVVINLLAGAISEAGALQGGDLLQDLKTGHLLGASPKAQFYGQLIGSGVGAVVSALVYRLYTSVYRIPGGLFQVPTGYVWVFTARLVTGSGLPSHTPTFALGFAALWAVVTAVRIYGNTLQRAAEKSNGETGFWASGAWTPYVPGGIAVAVGMYNTPSFTLARTAGGLLCWWWVQYKRRPETPVIVLASGLILGEGLMSIVNLGLASAEAPHL